MTSDTTSFRCPADVKTALEERARATGQRKTDVIVQILRQALGLPTVVDATPSVQRSLQTLNDRVARLEAILVGVDGSLEAMLGSIVEQLTEHEDRISLLGKKTYEPKVTSNIRTAKTTNQAQGSGPHGLKDIWNE